MSLKIRYDDMYNSDIKRKFIESSYPSDDSKKVIANVFYKSYYTEIALGLDLYNFNEEQLSSVMFSLELTTLSSAKGVGSTIKSYIDWCYVKGLRRSNLNIMDTVDDNWYKNTLDKTKKLLFTKKFIEETVEKLNDYQDKALIMLLFEGVYGKHLSEIRNLKLSDINEETNIATVYGEDKPEGRKVQLTPETVELVKNANTQDSYTNLDGKSFTLIDNDYNYIFRNTTKGRSEAHKSMTQIQLITRLKKIAEKIEMTKFNPNNINRSGMLYVYYQKLLKKNEGKLDFNYVNRNKDLEKAEVDNAIAEKYNWTLQKSRKGYTFYNTSNYRKTLLNLETVLDVYRDEYELNEERCLKIQDDVAYQNDVDLIVPEIKNIIEDVPVPKPKIIENVSTKKYKRNPWKGKNAILDADYLCEVNPKHMNFTSKITGENYVEAHHLIPMEFQEDFNTSIDVEANIVSLCVTCHKKLHHATFEEKVTILNLLYERRISRLKKCEIEIEKKNLFSYYD